MDDKQFDAFLKKSFRRNLPEINLHGIVMDQVEHYEKKKLSRSYLFEIIISSLLIMLSVVSIFFINWYFSFYKNIFLMFPISAGFMKISTISIFVLMLVIMTILDIRILYTLFKGKAAAAARL